jgi:hypothetical protein
MMDIETQKHFDLIELILKKLPVKRTVEDEIAIAGIIEKLETMLTRLKKLQDVSIKDTEE